MESDHPNKTALFNAIRDCPIGGRKCEPSGNDSGALDKSNSRETLVDAPQTGFDVAHSDRNIIEQILKTPANVDTVESGEAMRSFTNACDFAKSKLEIGALRYSCQLDLPPVVLIESQDLTAIWLKIRWVG